MSILNVEFSSSEDEFTKVEILSFKSISVLKIMLSQQFNRFKKYLCFKVGKHANTFESHCTTVRKRGKGLQKEAIRGIVGDTLLLLPLSLETRDIVWKLC